MTDIPSNDPEVQPFTYTFIPAEDSQDVEERFFNGASDNDLRESLGSHFKQTQLTSGQAGELSQKLQVKDPNIASSISDTIGFEIVPVVYPTPRTNYIGTSLYIDEVGTFKELPLNSRASKIAQRAIRGDAFLLQCMDNDAEDVWKRVDCTKGRYEELHSSPPSQAPDPQTQAKLQQLAKSGGTSIPGAITDNDDANHKITAEEYEKSQTYKQDATTEIKAGNFEKAIQHLDTAIKCLSGTPDPTFKVDHMELADFKRSVYSNRSLCNTKLEKWQSVVADCDIITQSSVADEVDNTPLRVKAFFRRGVARMNMGEFDEAESDLKEAQKLDPNDAGITKALQKDIPKHKEKFHKKEQEFYKGMFGQK